MSVLILFVIKKKKEAVPLKETSKQCYSSFKKCSLHLLPFLIPKKICNWNTKHYFHPIFFFFPLNFSPLFLFPWAHPVRLQARKLFSGGVIRLGLNSPAGRPVCDWRRPVPSACHLLTCLTGWGQQPQTGSLDGVFYSWAKNKKNK